MRSLLSYKALNLSLATAALLPTLVIAAPGHDHHDHASHAHKDGIHFFGHIDGIIHADHIYKAEESDEEIDEVYAHIDAHIGVSFNENFSLKSVVKLEGESALGGHGDGDGDEEINGKTVISTNTP